VYQLKCGYGVSVLLFWYALSEWSAAERLWMEMLWTLEVHAEVASHIMGCVS